MKKVYKTITLLFLFILIVLILAFSHATYVKDNVSIKVYFCPKDDCESILLRKIEAANNSIYCAFYRLDLKRVIDALNRNNLDVKIVLDKNSPWISVHARRSSGEQLMHNKFCVIDNLIVITGSYNPNVKSKHDINDLLIIYSKRLAENYKNEFYELWNGYFGSGEKTKIKGVESDGIKVETYFCPEDDCKNQIMKLLSSAKSNVYFVAFTLTHPELAKTLIKLKKRGINVAGIVERSSRSKWSKVDMLRSNEVRVRWDKYKYYVHSKFFVIDNKTVITGSANPTISGYERNDENILVIHDERVARLYVKEFLDLWKNFT